MMRMDGWGGMGRRAGVGTWVSEQGGCWSTLRLLLSRSTWSQAGTSHNPQTWRSSYVRFYMWRLDLKHCLFGAPPPNGSCSMILHWPSLVFYFHFKSSGYYYLLKISRARFWTTVMRGGTQWFSVFQAEVSLMGQGFPIILIMMWQLGKGANSEALPSSNPFP